MLRDFFMVVAGFAFGFLGPHIQLAFNCLLSTHPDWGPVMEDFSYAWSGYVAIFAIIAIIGFVIYKLDMRRERKQDEKREAGNKVFIETIRVTMKEVLAESKGVQAGVSKAESSGAGEPGQ